MTLLWTKSQPGVFRDAYLDWARMLGTRKDALAPVAPQPGCEYEPVFVRLVASQDKQAARQALLDELAHAQTPLFMDAHEHALLAERAADPAALEDLADEYALYRLFGTQDSDHSTLFDVLDTGVPVRLETAPRSGPAPRLAPPGPAKDAPIVALIDDGIGFLNARFRKPGGAETRFHAVWIQALETAAGPDGVLAGQVLDAARINGMIGRGIEADEYAALNAQLFPKGGLRSTDLGTSHGTHVLDLAAGAAPHETDPAQDWPLLGVQLPPQAIEDTSGTRFESYLVQGMRWILQQARQIDKTAPVIVNLSLGMLAGPKDGTRFAEYQVAREAAFWEKATGQRVRVVWAFGNTYRNDLVAQFTYPAVQTRSTKDRDHHITWRVQPSDQTASYLEIHTRGAADGLQVGLTAPDGTASGFAPLAPGSMRSLEADGVPVGRIYHVKARDYGAQTGTGPVSPAHFVLALSPTEGRKTNEPEAPAGAWTVHLRNPDVAAAEVILQIQRDDALRGFRVQARQSYFDAETAYDWDPEWMAHVGLSPAGPITHAGSQNALASVQARQVFYAGAARRSGYAPGQVAENYAPARYTSEGADWTVAGPTVAMVADDGPFLSGVIGAGTFSGSARFLAGTSAAAGRLSRALALSGLKIQRNASDADQSPSDDLNRTALDLVPLPPEAAARMGAFVVELPATGPARREG